MKIKKKVDKSTFAPAPKYSIVGCLLEDVDKRKRTTYNNIDAVFSADALIEVENICRNNPIREVAIESIKEFLSSRVDGCNINYVAAVLEASFRSKLLSERMTDELQDD